MRRCPTCHRTYTDESLNFCLADGAFLSAPNDPQPTEASPTLLNKETPTEILPKTKLTGHAATSPSPTISSQEETVRKQSLLPWLIAGTLAVAFIVYLVIPKGSPPSDANNLSARSNNQASNTNTSDAVLSNSNPGDRINDPHSPMSMNTSRGVGTQGIGDGTINANNETKRSGPLQPGNNIDSSKESSEDYNRVFSPGEVTQKAQILARPNPQYTDEARKNQSSGTVVLKAVLSSSGQVTEIKTVSGLPYGLTEKAVEAARQIKFTPAMKDGRPVSQSVQIEYNFSLY
jgi:TonB family protein